LGEIVLTYPLAEFIPWRASSALETVLLSLFQGGSGLLLLYSVWVPLSSAIPPWWAVLAAIPIFFTRAWNYSTLRGRVFKPLVGTIRTPD
jgi:hypothetical protein